MAEIINLEKAIAARNSSETHDLSELLRRATFFRERVISFQDQVSIVRKNQLKRIFEGKISQEIIAKKLISGEVFLCGIYVSILLEKLALSVPKSWWAIDYNNSLDPLTVKKGGDICFIICAIFPERADYRLMDIAYYEKMGRAMYYKLYGLTQKEIGYHMSHQFLVMVQVVQSCLQNF